MRQIILAATALALSGCSYFPSLSLGGPHLSNPAVEACEAKASEKFGGVGERQSTPGENGHYTVILDVRNDNGYGTATCTYDPSTGARIETPAS
jgi:hypothetical protein